MTPVRRPGPAVLRARARLGKAWSYRARPALLLRKTLQAWRRWTRRPGYGALFADGAFLPAIEGPQGDRLFTVAMPVWRVTEAHLRAAIASVVRQSYRNWELIVLDDASPDPHVRRVLGEAARSDPRIRAGATGTNIGIALATNRILEQARGEYVAFLDHDDLLHPRALELAGRFLTANPETDWLFTDHDKIDEDGRHHEPCLKPGWSHHLLLSFNYVSHLRVVRREMLERVGSHRAGFDGAQDYDLALRVLAAGGRFAHLPGVLYHWRAVRASMAMASAAKPAAHERALRALLEHAAGFPSGQAPSARVLLPAASFFEVRRPCPADVPLSIVDVAGDAGSWAGALGRPVEIRPARREAPGEALVAAAGKSSAPFLLLPPPAGMTPGQVGELLALLQVPGTAAAAGRWLARRRVVCSGWVATDDGGVWDPWAGLPEHDPGYLNLALVPGPRLVPPPVGIAVRRDAVLQGWDAAPEAAAGWRLPAGWARLGLEVVVAPTAGFRGVRDPQSPPDGSPPPASPVVRLAWLRQLGLAEGGTGRIVRRERHDAER